MLDKINDIKIALKANAYLSALALALTLPDICGKLEYPNITEEDKKKYICFQKSNGQYSTNGIKYAKWYDEHITKYSGMDQLDEPLRINGYKCYLLRCSYLHAGKVEGFPEAYFRLQITKSSETGGISCFSTRWTNDDETNKIYAIELDVGQFCYELSSVAEGFYKNNKEKLNFEDTHIDLIDWDKTVEKFHSL